jgi:hypothetical protein
MGIILHTVDGDTMEMSLDEFFNANEMEEEERGDIVSGLLMFQCYKGGGGAAPEWMIELNPEED